MKTYQHYITKVGENIWRPLLQRLFLFCWCCKSEIKPKLQTNDSEKKNTILNFLYNTSTCSPGCDYCYCYYDYDDDDDDVDDGDDYYWLLLLLLLLFAVTSTKVARNTDASTSYTAMMTWKDTTLRFLFYLIKTMKKKPFIIDIVGYYLLI